MNTQYDDSVWRIPRDSVDLERVLQVTGFVIEKKEIRRVNPQFLREPGHYKNEQKEIYWKRTGKERVVGAILYPIDENEKITYSVCYPTENIDVLNAALRLKNLFDINSIPYTEKNKDPIVGRLKTLTQALEGSTDGGNAQ